MSPNDVVRFFQMKRDTRLDMLYEYRSIVCGIYIYNKDSGFYGRESLDVSSLVVGGHAASESQLNIATDEVQGRIDMLTSFLDKHHGQLGDMIESTKKDEQRCSDVLQMRKVLIMQRQHMHYLRNLSRSMGRIKAEVDIAMRNFNSKLALITDKVQYKTAIPTEEIFVGHFAYEYNM